MRQVQWEGVHASFSVLPAELCRRTLGLFVLGLHLGAQGILHRAREVYGCGVSPGLFWSFSPCGLYVQCKGRDHALPRRHGRFFCVSAALSAWGDSLVRDGERLACKRPFPLCVGRFSFRTCGTAVRQWLSPVEGSTDCRGAQTAHPRTLASRGEVSRAAGAFPACSSGLLPCVMRQTLQNRAGAEKQKAPASARKPGHDGRHRSSRGRRGIRYP